MEHTWFDNTRRGEIVCESCRVRIDQLHNGFFTEMHPPFARQLSMINYRQALAYREAAFAEERARASARTAATAAATAVERADAAAAARQQLQSEREANDCPSLQFSRACNICRSGNPRRRAVYQSCGHIVCEPCAKEQSLLEQRCPFCRKSGFYIRILEEEMKSEVQNNSVNKGTH